MQFRKTKNGHWASVSTNPVLVVSSDIAQADIAEHVANNLGDRSGDGKTIFYGFTKDGFEVDIKSAKVGKPVSIADLILEEEL